MKQTTRLKALLARREAIPVPGTPNALFARVIESAGYPIVYLTGAGFANMQLGVPDIGLTTAPEVADMIAAITDAVSVPLIADGDTGFGNSLNVIRTVRLYERAGAAGIQIEDQVFPKKCGHFEGKGVIASSEMVSKIKAAVDARRDQDFQIIARTDARAIDGLPAAIERAAAFVEAGADVTFVEAPTSLEELATITRSLDVPQVANVVFGGKTPDLGRAKMAEMKFSIVLYANAILQATLATAYEVLQSLDKRGDLSGVGDRLASFKERQDAVNKGWWDGMDARYRLD